MIGSWYSLKLRLAAIWVSLQFVGVFAAPLLGDEGYLKPPANVVDILDAEPTPRLSASPDGQWLLLIQRPSMPSIADLSRRMLRLGGLRIDPVANSRFSGGYNRGVSLRPLAGGVAVQVPLPDEQQIAEVAWSHRSNYFTVTTVSDAGSQLWLVSVDSPTMPKCMVTNLHSLTMGIEWQPDGQSLICGTVPSARGPEPQPPRIPNGPNIQESAGLESPVRTYQDLLSNPYDEALFEYYATVQLTEVTVAGDQKPIGHPAIYSDVSTSPDGQYRLVTRVKRPFSYLHPISSFPKEVEVWNIAGDRVYSVADIPLADNIPIEGVQTGRRSIRWRANEPASLLWAEALDGGDPRTVAAHRDQLFVLSAPFQDEPRELVKVQHRFAGITEFADANLVVVTEMDRDRRWMRTLMYDQRTPASDPLVLMDRSMRDRYGDPGQLVSDLTQNGQRVVRQDGDWVYRSGAGASPQGNLPFLDRQNLKTLATERMWRCQVGFYESVIKVLESGADKKPVVLISRESNEFPPNLFRHDLHAGNDTAVTSFADPTPQIRGIQKQLVKYERADGVPLSATLYLPADYVPGTRLPLFVWAYPLEFNDAATAGQVAGSPWEFTRISGSSHLTLLTQGYAVMDNATMPIIGDPATMNDTFVEQIVQAADAAINKAVELGVADPNRVGVGGHSYGAFMTANLLAHTDLFKAGVARSGAYNRTLTPFGFQSERRTYWEAPEVYMKVSPFSHAHRINQPLLLIHGEADNNPGTFPLQSQRLFQAVKGTGGNTRLVMLPYESHGYQARESILHTQAETIRWLDKYVKNASGSAP
ncbi:MAG: prolyl oligopeptidase family serine peptidase [Pirellulaceae bacterium]|nr:prolyl oligopeptidase family serine peptidase [Pirellulaceae bacterium]